MSLMKQTLKVALNIGHRYPIIRRLNGAFFIDAGNIWNFKNNCKPITHKFLTTLEISVNWPLVRL